MRCIFKERPDRGETCVAASNTVASILLEMVQEGEQQRRVEIGQSDGAGRSTECCRRVVEEQAQGIPVCRYGLSADRTLLAEMIQKRSEEHTSELQSLMRISYAVFCLKKQTTNE